MPNTWTDFVKSQKGHHKTTSMLSQEWQDKQANLVTLNIQYVASLVQTNDELREKLRDLTCYCNYLEGYCNYLESQVRWECGQSD